MKLDIRAHLEPLAERLGLSVLLDPPEGADRRIYLARGKEKWETPFILKSQETPPPEAVLERVVQELIPVEVHLFLGTGDLEEAKTRAQVESLLGPEAYTEMLLLGTLYVLSLSSMVASALVTSKAESVDPKGLN